MIEQEPISKDFLHLINSGLWYCSIRECQNCGHQTLQESIRLEGEKEVAFTCLNCGKIWHLDQKIVEYKSNTSGK